jgi:hypothetical protein
MVKLTGVAQYRIQIMAAIAIGVIAGLIHFYQQFLLHPSYGETALHGFLTLSFLGIALITPYLWNDWLQQRGIEYFQVFVVVVLGFGAFHWFSRNNPMRAVLDLTIFLLVLIVILAKLLRSTRTPKQVINPAVIQTEDSKPSSGPRPRPSAKYFGLLLIWLMAVALFSSHVSGPIPVWVKTIYVLPAVWLGCQVIFHLFKRKGLSGCLYEER